MPQIIHLPRQFMKPAPLITQKLVQDVIAEVEADEQERRKRALATIQIDALVRCCGLEFVESCVREIRLRRDAAHAGDPRR